MKRMKIIVLSTFIASILSVEAQSHSRPKMDKSPSAIFKKVDLNADGFIDLNELAKQQDVKKARAAEKAKEFKIIDVSKKLKRIDSNKDQKINFEEFAIHFEKNEKRRMEGKSPESRFKKLDLNANRIVDLQEFEKFIAQRNTKRKEAKPINPKKAFNRIDLNSDAQISMQEFILFQENKRVQ